MIKKPNIKIFFALIIISLTIGIISIKLLPQLPSGDGKDYILVAKTLIEENTYYYHGGDKGIFKPGYPVFLAGVFSLFGYNLAIVKLLQFLFLGIISCLIFKIAEQFFKLSKKLSFFISLIIIFWPYFILYSNLILTEILYILFFIWFAYEFLNLIHTPNNKNTVKTSLALALATLTRPNPLLLPIWLIFFLIVLKILKEKQLNIIKKIQKKYIILTILSLFLFITFLTPWSIFASKVTGKFTFVSSNTSNIFKLANVDFNKETFNKLPGYEKNGKWTLNKLMTAKFRNFFLFWKSGATGWNVNILQKKYPIAKYFILLYRILYYFLIIFLGFSSLFFIKKNQNILYLWIIIIYVWMFHMALFNHPRFTLPIIPLMAILGFYSLQNYWELCKNKFKAA